MLRHTTLTDAIDRGLVGLSPAKQGRPCKIPQEFTRSLATHSSMLQASGKGEADKAHMIPLIEGLKSGTKHDFNSEYAWRKCRQKEAGLMMPTYSLDVDDNRIEWLTYSNVNQMFDMFKKVIIDAGMAKDEPGMIRKYFVREILCNAC